MRAAVDALAATSLLVVASPTYKTTYTGLLKSFLDWYGTTGLAGVVAVPVLVGAGLGHALAVEVHLRPLVVEINATVATRGLYVPEDRLDELASRADGGLPSSTMHEHEHGERFGPAAQAADWDAKYSERDGAMWSGRPNGRLVAEAADLTPGRALDVGCGEGADAVWLARRGWTVTAIDISGLAVSRAREAAELAGAAVEWVCGDALRTPFPVRSFDLVSMQYPALPKAAGAAAVRTLLDAVRHGGLLLAVYHDLDDEHREHMRAKGVDPADYIGAGDLAQLLEDDFTVEMHAVEPRIDPPPGTAHIADVVLRARRR